MKCTSKNKRGERCGRNAAIGHTKCNRHGAEKARGIDVHTFKHGRYSKYLPQRLLERFYEAEQDAELLSLHRYMVLLEVRLSDLMGEIHLGGSKELWRSLKQISDQLLVCRRMGDSAGMSDCLNTLIETIRKGNKDYQVWAEMASVIEQQRKLSETEQKRLVAMQQYMSVEEAMLYGTAIMELVRTNVSNPKEIAAIAKGYQDFLQRNNSARMAGS